MDRYEEGNLMRDLLRNLEEDRIDEVRNGGRRQYFVLAGLPRDGDKWEVIFGAYYRDDVRVERETAEDTGDWKKLKILTMPSVRQAAIDDAISAMNEDRIDEAHEIHVPIKELPDSLRDALKRVKYGSRDIGVVAQDKVDPNPYAAEGQKGFVQVIDIASGRSRDLEGSWGGASPNNPSEIDFANRPVPIPEGGAVIIGVQGYPQTMATIYVHPKTIAAMLPPAAETTEREQTILRTIRSLNSAGRKEVFGREKVTPAEIDALVARGLLKKTKAGAVSITTDGKNVAEGQEDGMRDLLDRLEDSVLEATLRSMSEAESDALGDEIDEALTSAQRQAKTDYKRQDWAKTQQRADTVVRSMAAINKYSTKRLMSMAKTGAGPGPGNQAMHKAIMMALRSRITKAKKSGGLKLRTR